MEWSDIDYNNKENEYLCWLDLENTYTLAMEIDDLLPSEVYERFNWNKLKMVKHYWSMDRKQEIQNNLGAEI